MLDLGCGSGILSIAALRLGAGEAFACDIDDKCLDVAYENAALNGIGRTRYTVRPGTSSPTTALQARDGRRLRRGGGQHRGGRDHGPGPGGAGLLQAGGVFLCSGIIDDRAEEVGQGLREDGWDVIEQRQSEGWYSFLCR